MQAPDLESVLRDAYRRFNEDGIEAILALLDQEIEWHDLPQLPGATVHRGHRGVARMLSMLFDALERYQIEVEKVLDTGQEVVAVVWVSAWGRGSRVPLKYVRAHVWTFGDREATAPTATRCRVFADEASALEALGLSSGAG